MKKPLARRHAPPPHSRGFTLIEMLMVIAVLSILMALLVAAVVNARRPAVIAQVKTEMGQFSTAIQTFKTDFGMIPPSQITLEETGGSWSAASQAVIGSLWPQFDFSLDRDLNDDGDTTDTITLYGAECLVFFLCGVPVWNDVDGSTTRNAGDTWYPNGFARNPADPFSRTGTNRQGPYYTNLKTDRLVASTTHPGFYGYSDPYPGTQVVYLYASGNDGQGYNEDSSGNGLDLGGAMSYYYRQGSESATSPPFSSPFWNSNSFQLICAGADRQFGTGGPYTKENAANQLTGNRDAERDNITNFSDGVLAP